MKVFFHNDFYQVYASDPAAAKGRMEAVVRVIEPHVTFVEAESAYDDDVSAVHTESHIDHVRDSGVYPVALLAAGATVQAAELGLTEPCLALVRPPGHHASSNSAWGFCYFNNMAIAVMSLLRSGRVKSACILDIDLHYGDGTVNILGERDDVVIFNIDVGRRDRYMREVEQAMNACTADIIGISAGFDNHLEDWGGTLATEDYYTIGQLVTQTAKRNNGGSFAVLEGGYNHDVLGQNVLSLIQGMSEE